MAALPRQPGEYEGEDDEVQILTPAEAAAEVEAAAREAASSSDELVVAVDGTTPSTTSRKRKRPRVETKAEPTECTICCEPCMISGRHRLVALKCGHLFGKKCIERWTSDKRTCPNCNTAVRRTDIRPLFSDHVAVVDNSGVEDMTQKYEAEKSKRIHVETELARAKLQVQMKTAEVTRLGGEVLKWKKMVVDLRCKTVNDQFASESQETDTREDTRLITSGRPGLVVAGPERLNRPAWPIQSQPASSVSLESTELERCRSEPAAASSSSSLSQPPMATSNDPFVEAIQNYKSVFDFPLENARVFDIARSCSFLCVGESLGRDAYGVLMLSSRDPRHMMRVRAHSSPVRDLCINEKEDTALTVAFDGKLVVTNLHTQSVVLQLQLPPGRRQGWSCALSEDDPFAMYCGFQDGTVAKYDIRKPTGGEQGIVTSFSLPERQPVHSIQLFRGQEEPRAEGLAAATLRGLSVWKNVIDLSTDSNVHAVNRSRGLAAATPDSHVAIGGQCCSLSLCRSSSSKMVVSSRSQGWAPARHDVYDLRTLNSTPLLPTTVLLGHKTPPVFSRSAIWTEANGASAVASWCQDSQLVTIWDVANRREVRGPEPTSGSLASVSMPVVDIQHAVAGGDWSSRLALFGTMTARQLCVYRSGA
ncbi:hypothetical protein BBJ28_00017568 [Nothophytophthora sp. Chile5]|nr:hypothetical protein BBJ28_00017568 [Nothophytophthora sp. Chile5]